ncbi:hypothetical protein [Methylomonas koyamae]|uniref:hypothetical protein n=1 Tax=Methylomonas koyamae TaxID=702114 RepID=UPI001125DFB0|nr:hypothetical protein [Methylomonas koyamae]TPQ26951.1 hypothetical protein C2U68_09690 [Methylomonas koyamae]
MKTWITYLLLVCGVCASALAVSAPADIAKLFGRLPTITRYERSCVLSASTPAELKACINNLPNTEYYSRERTRSLGRLDALNTIVADLNAVPDLNPIEKFCLFTSTPACMEACIQGWVCSAD